MFAGLFIGLLSAIGLIGVECSVAEEKPPMPASGPTVTLPPRLQALPGRILTLHAQTDGAIVRWAITEPEVDLVPFPDGKTALFCSARAGRFVVLAWTAQGDVPSEAARCEIVVGGNPPPGPPTPGPSTDLFADLQRLYRADESAEKSVHLKQLAVLYREAVRFVESSTLATAGDLATRLRAASAAVIPASALVPLRHRLAEELARQLTTDRDQPLDDALRRRAAQLFDQIAGTLERVLAAG